ncbi:MAG: hypothetical protein HYR55_17425 [Acidobacteria bacterium]|nr:hypothetical protein [Acidobacteriota bacterium]MBI3657074.1 hypothetical protein [Acidobacteriota bacterium]
MNPGITRSAAPSHIWTPLLIMVLVGALTLHAQPPSTLQNLFDGTARFVEDTDSGLIGGSFGMHFLSTLWIDDQLWAYYIKNYQVESRWKSAVGLAISGDGINFTDQGLVMDISGAWQWVYDAARDLFHQVGRADADGWSASTGLDSQGHLCYGPYTPDIPEGPNTVSFQLMIDNNSADDLPVVNLDVYDAASGAILATRQVRRREFSAPFHYQIFNVSFRSPAGHALEFRTWWYGVAYIRESQVALSQGVEPFFDNRLASFPGIWKDGDTFYLVYEGAGEDRQWPGDIGLATSTDGLHFAKHPNNPILRHEGGWESANIGTPSLWKEGDTWYLFYHGFDGRRVQIGVATGVDLAALNKYPGNPIVPAGPFGNWDEGTVGKRSLLQQDGVYYMIFEGSTRPPYDRARWSSGVARSPDLFNWEKFSGNPLIPQTSSGFGYDGPEFVTIGGTVWTYFRHPLGATGRAALR